MKRLFWSVVIISVLGSCVPNRKITYLQKDDVKKKDMPRDTILRTYPLKLTDYRIQPMDLLSIRIESLTSEDYDFFAKLNTTNQGASGAGNMQVVGFLVDNSGEVEYPVVGRVKVAGLTIFEAQDKLGDIVEAYLKQPVVQVRVLNFRYTMIGEVVSEKQVVSSNTRISFAEAIGLGGGLGELADRSKIKVIRQNGPTAEVFYLNLLEEQVVESPYYYVQQNDVIVVPALSQRSFRKYYAQNFAIFLSTLTAVLVMVDLIVSNNNSN